MNKPDLSVSVANSGVASGSANSGMAKQAIAFVEDFAAFAGLNGIWAAALAVICRGVRRRPRASFSGSRFNQIVFDFRANRISEK
jgi:hypothetical protein